MRGFFLLLLLAGVALGGGYPWYINNFSGAQIGAWTVYDRGSGFRAVDVPLTASQAPVRVFVDLTTVANPPVSKHVAVLTLSADIGARTVLADTMDFTDSARSERSPQSQASMLRAQAGIIDPVESATYRFTVAKGDAQGVNFTKVELELRAGAQTPDPRAMPVGFGLAGVSLVGLIIALRMRRSARREAEQAPPPPQWGRGK